MKTKAIPETWLRCMSPEDRKAISQMTAEEAMLAFAERNERGLQRLISQELSRRGIVAVQSGMHRKTSTPKGTPDFLFAYHGVPYAIEAKTGIGKLSQEQEKMLKQLRENGWITLVVRSFDEFKTIFNPNLEQTFSSCATP